MNDSDIQWPDLLECYYGVTLNDRQAVVWFSELRNANNADLCAAIRLAGNEGTKPIEFRATVMDVSRWLGKYRAIQAQSRNKSESDARLALFKSEWIEKLGRGAKRDDFLASVDQLQYGVVQRNEICKEVLEAVK
jgi:hypothetical protein